ncbi:MAG: ATP-binding cassette domain-containing protein, partial [candidate division WOR-3 bacterium]
MLTVSNLTVAYGAISALREITFTVEKGEIVTLIGANGAGKTTTLKCISGLIRPRRGEILFEGEKIDRLPAHQITKMGIVQVPEGRRPFVDLTVRENLLLGAFNRPKNEIPAALERV